MMSIEFRLSLSIGWRLSRHLETSGAIMSRDRASSSHRSRDERKHHSSSHKKAKSAKEKRRHRGDSDGSDAPRELPAGAARISEDDYFLRATEFRVWLKQRRNKYVEELSTEEATRLFETKFVKRWNDGRLDRMFYEGIPEKVLESTRRTRHAWGFVQKLTDRELMDLASAKDSVGVATRKSNLLASRGQGSEKEQDQPSRDVGPRKRELRDTLDPHLDDDQRHRVHADTKRLRKHLDSVIDELVPRETGREALLERRRQLAEKVHGAAREREANQDGLDLEEAFLMGGSSKDGTDDFQRRLSKRTESRQRREEELRERADAAQAKETARMDKFLQDMGLSVNNGRPITIPPRRDS